MKSLNVSDAFSFAGCTKSIIERVVIVQTDADDGENGRFFFFFPKKNSNSVQITGFFLKNKKNLPFSPSWASVWTIITISNLEVLIQPANEKTSETFKLFI